MPWIHLNIDFKGQVKACCVSSITYGNINRQSVNDIWKGKQIQQIRKQFLKGEVDNRCLVCINREKSGAKSLRQETFENYSFVNIVDNPKPIYFDIRFSNVCNFKCRTCWHGASSKWFEDAKKLKSTASKHAIIKNIEDVKYFIFKNENYLINAKEIYFAGGEPLVTEEHYWLLEFLLENHQNLNQLKLRYNTNFSVLKFKNYDVLDFWKYFKVVEIQASIDESEQLGEYIRKGFNWQTFLSNLSKVKSYKNIKFKIAPTVSVFNVKTLPSFYQLCVSQNMIDPKHFYINLLDRPYHYNCKALSPLQKQKINQVYTEFYQWCEQNKTDHSIVKQFKAVQSFMNADDYYDKHYQKFLKITQQLDDIRKETFSQIE
ncbi:MAG TPA: twitch domain-containing radical SAM protein [Crocinitomix sp.]|nr:twitch domain-containing radical SAM protein [Crocinitomix sp.]